MSNNRPCGLCRNLDSRKDAKGEGFCWDRYRFVQPSKIIADCEKAERADGSPPPGKISFEGEQT